MGSHFHPRFYDDATLKVLESAFQDICHSLKLDAAPTQLRAEVRAVVAEKLIDCAEIGIADVKELRERVLSSLRN